MGDFREWSQDHRTLCCLSNSARLLPAERPKKTLMVANFELKKFDLSSAQNVTDHARETIYKCSGNRMFPLSKEQAKKVELSETSSCALLVQNPYKK